MRSSEINMLLKMGVHEGEIRNLRKSIKGAVFTVSAGTTTGNLQVGGNAKYILGFRAFDPAGLNTRIDLLLNQEIIYTSVEENLIDTVLSSCNEEYVETFRQIKPQDVLNVSISSTGNTTVNILVFYLNIKTA